MFKKAKRVNLRRRNESDEDDEARQACGPAATEEIPFMESSNYGLAAANHGNGFQPGGLKTVKREKKAKETVPAAAAAPKASLLSFDDDDEEEGGSEVFRVKKSNHSKKIVKQLKKEYKEDLEKTGSVKQEPCSDAPLQPAAAVVIKEEPASGVASEQGEEEMEVDSGNDQEEEAKGQSGTAHDPASKGNSVAGSFNTLSSLSSLRPGEIPDAAFIHAARKRRQMARELGGDAPLVDAEAPKKRLVREEEQDDGSDDDEEEKRIRFSGVRNKTQRQKIAEEIGIEGSDDEGLDAGHDEEVSRWEQEQIKKGISIPQVQATLPDDGAGYYQNSYDTQPYGSSYSMPFVYGAVAPQSGKPPDGANHGPLPYRAPSNLTPVSIDLVKKRLRDR